MTTIITRDQMRPGQIVQRGPELLTIEQSSPGSDVTLTLDANLQRFIEQRLAKALKDYDANGGSIIVNGRRSAESLYDFNLATYDEGDSFDQSSAKGFVHVHGLSSKISAQRDLRQL